MSERAAHHVIAALIFLDSHLHSEQKADKKKARKKEEICSRMNETKRAGKIAPYFA